MIPPLLMDIKPGMTVLDVCAAPGSKAAQLIEMVHGGEEARIRKVIRQFEQDEGRGLSPEADVMREEMQEEEKKRDEDLDSDWSDDGRATGLLIANDSDYRRAHMLTHQMKRLNSPNLIVMNHDATMFPSIRLPSDPPPLGSTANRNKYLKFDRILADVPCSGDGTCRKNYNVWKDWTPGNALGLNPTQVRILVRALQMLKVGGKVVYSTCSMNPIENEAVVAAAIDRCGGLSKVDLVDCGEALPKLKRRPGLQTWSVMDKQSRFWASWTEVQEEKEINGEEGLGKINASMFPPLGDEKPDLRRCLRVYPHLQDTGAFFICVLEKRSEIKAKPEENSKSGDGVKKPDQSTQKPQKPQKPGLTASIIDTVNEIQSLSPDTATSCAPLLPKLATLDSILPPTLGEEEAQDPSAAARQNQANWPPENGDDHATNARKRELDAIADAESATKRPKFKEEVDDPAPAGEEERRVHWPPPPAAELDISRPAPMDATSSTEAASKNNESYTNGTTPVENQADTRRLNAISSSAVTNGKYSSMNANQGRKHAPNNNGPFEEPFIYLSPTHPALTQISAFYAVSPRFPLTRFMVRNATGEPVKTIYYTSALAKAILTANGNVGSGMKFVHCGVKMFVRQDVQQPDVCPWRIQSEGLPIVGPWVGECRVVRLWRKRTLRILLQEMFPKVQGEGWRHLGEIGRWVRDVGMGCCVLRVGPKPIGVRDEDDYGSDYSDSDDYSDDRSRADADGDGDEGGVRLQDDTRRRPDASDDAFGPEQRMTLPLWRSLYSLNLMLPKQERKAMLLRLYDDDTPLMDSSKDRFARRQQQGERLTDVGKIEGDDDVTVDREEVEGIEEQVLAEGAEARDHLQEVGEMDN